MSSLYAAMKGVTFCSASDVSKIDRYLNRCKCLNYCSLTTTCITELFDKADRSLFQTVLSDKHHVLNRLLPASKTQQYNLRPRSHNLTLTCKSKFYDNCNFITRMLFKESCWHFCVIWTLALFVTCNRIVATFYFYCIAVSSDLLCVLACWLIISWQRPFPVSYTHLTLPTIYSV